MAILLLLLRLLLLLLRRLDALQLLVQAPCLCSAQRDHIRRRSRGDPRCRGRGGGRRRGFLANRKGGRRRLRDSGHGRLHLLQSVFKGRQGGWDGTLEESQRLTEDRMGHGARKGLEGMSQREEAKREMFLLGLPKCPAICAI